MHFGGDEVAYLNVSHRVADGRDRSAKLVAGNVGRLDTVLCPLIPLEDVKISAADGSRLHCDQHVGGTEGGDRDFTHLHAGCSKSFDQGVHHFRQRHQNTRLRSADAERLNSAPPPSYAAVLRTRRAAGVILTFKSRTYTAAMRSSSLCHLALRASVVATLISTLAAEPAWGWGRDGHMMINELAARALPDEVPVVFAQSEWTRCDGVDGAGAGSMERQRRGGVERCAVSGPFSG